MYMHRQEHTYRLLLHYNRCFSFPSPPIYPSIHLSVRTHDQTYVESSSGSSCACRSHTIFFLSLNVGYSYYFSFYLCDSACFVRCKSALYNKSNREIKSKEDGKCTYMNGDDDNNIDWRSIVVEYVTNRNSGGCR